MGDVVVELVTVLLVNVNGWVVYGWGVDGCVV